VLPYIHGLSHTWTPTAQYIRLNIQAGTVASPTTHSQARKHTHLLKPIIMKLISFIIPLSAVLPAARSVLVHYDTVYDNPANSLSTVACSDGKNGMITKGYKTFGDLPSFPHIGAAYVVEGYNSASCGSCWELSYTNDKTTTSINVIAIDHAAQGFVLAETALQHLGGQQAVDAGKINATATRVGGNLCGLKS
jgi:hypothetical protein